MLVDSHAHLGDDRLFIQAEEIQKRAEEAQVEYMLDICTNLLTLERGHLLQEMFSQILLAAATTPHDVEKEGEEFFPVVEKAALEGKLVAIGETGLDYFYEHSPKELQKAFLVRYFALAKKTSLPIIFHCRDAFQDLFTLARENYPQGKALIHCFTGTKQEAAQALDLGWYISLSGIVTFKKSVDLKEVAAYIPLDRLLIETDAPYLAPESKRGQCNEPSFIAETARVLAEIKGISTEDLALQTKKNFFALLEKEKSTE